MIRATVRSRSCFGWLYTASQSSTVNNVTNLMNRISFLGVSSRRSYSWSVELINFSFFGIDGRGIDLDYCDVKWLALEMNQNHSVIFEVVPRYCISDSFVDYEGYSISSKGFLLTVVDIMVIWIKFTHSGHFSLLIPKILMFILIISCLITSNFLCFTDVTFQVLMRYCSLKHWILLSSPDTWTTSIISFFAQLLHSFWWYW